MPIATNIGTGSIPLKLASKITNKVNQLWESGDFLEKVSPTTASLLKYWFCEPYTLNRLMNFHQGQKQAILNTIYLHEILKVSSVPQIYEHIQADLMLEMDMKTIQHQKYQMPKYAIKMATGTGKTWVMNAFLIWQYLNAYFAQDDETRQLYSKNFLLIAPGLIVYERLLDSYLGKQNTDGSRDFTTSDISKNEDLFMPHGYREIVLSFIQNSVIEKEDIGTKITPDGMIIITNWHVLMEKEKSLESPIENLSLFEDDPLNNPEKSLNEIFPVIPGRSGGNELNQLDRRYFSGTELEYLCTLDNLIVINDEAHHIHETKQYGVIEEVEWQKSLNRIAKNKGRGYIQFDFSATPYDVTGSGENRTKHFFPHVIVNFDLIQAIQNQLVKLINIDKRKELATIPLDFKATRDQNSQEVLSLSEGQRLMIRAGFEKLTILEKQFKELNEKKNPKMLIMCEDTSVISHVEDFLRTLMNEQDFISIHSNQKGEIKEKEWQTLKQKVFNIDQLESPKVIISVLMLREGFDVSNICVIVPLRSSQAPILLEQTIGRGLRLMFREPHYQESKQERYDDVIKKKEKPSNLLDMLFIVEHPSFVSFYDELQDYMDSTEYPDDWETGTPKPTGDLITEYLKENYKNNDLYWISLIKESEEELQFLAINVESLDQSPFDIDYLKRQIGKGETFYSEEITVNTIYGSYKVNGDLFKALNYNDYLQKMLVAITQRLGRIKLRGHRKLLPTLQIYHPHLMGLIDRYIRYRLFGNSFDPFKDEQWRLLVSQSVQMPEFIIGQIAKVIYDIQQNTISHDAEISKTYFSSVSSLKMRQQYSIECVKTIFNRMSYPSNYGGTEHEFMKFLETDSHVHSWIKINHYQHTFAGVAYIRQDGLIANYFPDFLVKTHQNQMLIIEIKAENNLSHPDVVSKEKAVLSYISQINQLPSEERDNLTWNYLIIGDKSFYLLQNNGANIQDFLQRYQLKQHFIDQTLF